MRIAMIGLRGVPARSGGIECVTEQLGTALAGRGHEVTVYCRSNYVDHPESTYAGMRLRVLPTIATKHLDAIVHTALATGDALRGYDVLHYHALGPGLLAPIPRALSRKSAVVQTVHGVDWQRAKWGRLARGVLRSGELLSTRVPHELIVPSQSLADHYRQSHGARPTVIANPFSGVTPRPPTTIGTRYGLEPGRYLLFVGRLTPEKQVDVLLRAFRRVVTDERLVIVGGSSFTNGHVDELRALAAEDPRVVMTGELCGAELEELFSNARAFATPSALEGFNMTLVEAISAGLSVIASAIGPHVELLRPLGPAARLFAVGDEASLARAIRETIADANAELATAAARRYRAELLRRFDAGRIAALTEEVYERALARRLRTAARLLPRSCDSTRLTASG